MSPYSHMKRWEKQILTSKPGAKHSFTGQNIQLEDSQSYYNWLEHKLITIVDTLAPYET